MRSYLKAVSPRGKQNRLFFPQQGTTQDIKLPQFSNLSLKFTFFTHTTREMYRSRFQNDGCHGVRTGRYHIETRVCSSYMFVCLK